MENRILTFQTQIPELTTSFEFTKNCWISPTGQFWGFEGAKHEIAAAYIAIFTLGADDKTLKKGVYFNESWEGWLLKQDWLVIKNVSWLTGDDNPSTFRCSEWSERQKTTVFDYCEFFKFDYNKVIENGNE